MSRHELAQTLPWLASGTEFLLAEVDQLSDDELRAASALPGWSRAHVVGHLARNAEALVRLATWARTGVETPMYPSREARDADIEASAAFPVSRLRAELVDTASQLTAALDALDETSWRASVRSGQGRTIPASEIPWLRVREVWLHSVDLGSGARMADLPPGLLDELLTEVAGMLSDREGCPNVLLAPTDRERAWSLGPAEPTVTLRGSAAALTGWLLGRDPGTPPTVHTPDGTEVPLPTAPRWL